MQQIENIGIPNRFNGLGNIHVRAVKNISVKLTSGISNETLRFLGVVESTSSIIAICIGTLSGSYLGLNIY